MAINIKSLEVEKVARELARETRETLTQAIHKALLERLARIHVRKSQVSRYESALMIAKECAASPELDGRSIDEILGYDRHGLP